MWSRLFVVAVVVAVGCGSPRQMTPADASAGDGAGDAGTDATLVDAMDAGIDAPPGIPGNVSVTVYDVNGVPAAAMPVVFLNADDSIVAMTATNAQGVASATMVAGGSVTAQRPRPAGITGDWIYTFLAVEPGDALLVGEPPASTPTTFQTTFVVPTKTGTEVYYVDTNCGSGAAVGATNVVADLTCTTVDVLVTARNSDLDVIGVLFKSGVAVTAGATIDLSAEVWKGFKTITVTIDNVPLDVVNAPNFVFADVIAPYAADTWAANFTFTTMGAVKRGTATLDVYDIQALDVLYNVMLYRPHPTTQEILVRVAGGQDVTIDLGPKLLPWFSTGVSPNAATGTITWTELPGAAADYMHIGISAIRSDASRYTWELAGPAGPGVFELPTLPGSFAAYNLQSSYSINTDRVYLRRLPGGWDSIRECALSPDCFYPMLAQGQYAVASGPDGITP